MHSYLLHLLSKAAAQIKRNDGSNSNIFLFKSIRQLKLISHEYTRLYKLIVPWKTKPTLSPDEDIELELKLKLEAPV